MNDKKKKKEFAIPVAEIVDFINEDIITSSDNATTGWDNDGYRERWW